jgi:hypothetical protein
LSKLKCACGHRIVDQAGALPYKAGLIADGDRLWEDVAADVAAFVALRTARERARWLAARFGAGYPADATDAEAVHDIMTGAVLGVRRTVYECESCGRLWLQAHPDGQRFRGYAPEPPGTGALRPVGRGADGHPHQPGDYEHG